MDCRLCGAKWSGQRWAVGITSDVPGIGVVRMTATFSADDPFALNLCHDCSVRLFYIIAGKPATNAPQG